MLYKYFLLTGVHTQHIERVWREEQIFHGTRNEHLEVERYLAEFLFKRFHKY